MNTGKRVLIAAAVTAAAIGMTASVYGTQPPEHLVTICHATPPDTAAQGYQEITVDVASVGYQQSGHQEQHAADIIPAYNFGGSFVFVGLNLGNGGSATLANHCVVPTPPPSDEPPDEEPPTTPPTTTVPPVTTVPPAAPASPPVVVIPPPVAVTATPHVTG